MLGFGKKIQQSRCPSITDAVVQVVKGIERMKNPPKTIDVIFFPDGRTAVREPQSFYLEGQMYTYELKPKGGPECSE